jgi:hypothetical protein
MDIKRHNEKFVKYLKKLSANKEKMKKFLKWAKNI